MKLSLAFILVFFLGLQSSFASSQCTSVYESAFKSISEPVAIELTPEQFDLTARTIIRKLKLTSDQAKYEVANWVHSMQQRQQSGNSLSVMEHTSLQLVLRTKFLESISDDSMSAEMKKIYETSWFQLTGQKKSFRRILHRRLPANVTKNETVQVQRFLKMVDRVDPKTLKIREPLMRRFFSKVWPVALLAVGLSHAGFGILAGAAAGYVISLVGEYALHRWFLHATPQRQKIMEDAGLYLRPEDNVPRDHLMHHRELSAVKNAENYIKRGANDLADLEIQKMLIPEMEKVGIIHPAAQKSYVEDTQHGTNLSKRVKVVGHMIFMPLGLLAGYIVGGDMPILSAVAGAVFANSFMYFVGFHHPRLHQTRGEILDSSSMLGKIYFDSAFFRSVSRFHYMHHVRSNTNFHIMPGGFDRIMKTEKKPDLVDILSMLEADLMF
jgi:hypothetical protein